MLFRLLGKAAFHLGEQEQAVLAYTRATDINESALPAWKGLVEVFSATGDAAKAAPAYTRLVCKRAPAVSFCEDIEKGAGPEQCSAAQLALSATQEPAKQREYRLGLIDALLRCRDWQRAEQELLQAQAEPGEQDEWVQLQRQLVDVQVQPRQMHSLAACLTSCLSAITKESK